MNLQPLKELLKKLISEQLNTSISSIDLNSVSGGSINHTYGVTVNHDSRFFRKLNSSTEFPGLFEKEKKGLEFLALQNCISTPAVVACDMLDNYQLLLLQWIDTGIRN